MEGGRIHRDAINAMTEVGEFEKLFMGMIIEKRKIDNEREQELDDVEDRLAGLEIKIKPDI